MLCHVFNPHFVRTGALSPKPFSQSDVAFAVVHCKPKQFFSIVPATCFLCVCSYSACCRTGKTMSSHAILSRRGMISMQCFARFRVVDCFPTWCDCRILEMNKAIYTFFLYAWKIFPRVWTPSSESGVFFFFVFEQMMDWNCERTFKLGCDVRVNLWI